MIFTLTYQQTPQKLYILITGNMPQALSIHLETLGFQECSGVTQKWYAPAHPSYINYVKALSQAIDQDKAWDQVHIQPAYSSKAEYIETQKFSYVTISYQDNGRDGFEDYVLFESYKRIALVIARRYAKAHYGNQLLNVEVYPRTQKQNARLCYKAGRVLDGKSMPRIKALVPAVSTPSPSPTTSPNPLVLETAPPKTSKTTSLTTAHPPKAERPTPNVTEVETQTSATTKDITAADYLPQIIAHMHDAYYESRRLSKTQIEALIDRIPVPSLDVLWETVELSWLLWYKMLYKERIPFEARLEKMTRFWYHVQPTYAQHSKAVELYYSTPCPIAAMVGQYTCMDTADTIFEPSASNGLLLVGADPKRTHVNDRDGSWKAALDYQGFADVTERDAALPFPEPMHKAYDVVVACPPNAPWDVHPFDKLRTGSRYFGKHKVKTLVDCMGLDHIMTAVALHNLKDTGKAAIILKGHITFGYDGHIEDCRPFFTWLYRNYNVDDIINLDGHRLYSKQRVVEKTMLILIDGRKAIPEGRASYKHIAPQLETVVCTFDGLWERIESHIKPCIDTIITQLQQATTQKF